MNLCQRILQPSQKRIQRAGTCIGNKECWNKFTNRYNTGVLGGRVARVSVTLHFLWTEFIFILISFIQVTELWNSCQWLWKPQTPVVSDNPGRVCLYSIERTLSSLFYRIIFIYLFKNFFKKNSYSFFYTVVSY